MPQPFTTRLTVTVGDLNYGAHVGNDRFLLFFHEARLRFLAESGYSELDIGDGVGLIMSEAHVKYLAQVGMGEDLDVEVNISDLGKIRFTMNYRIVKADGKTAAEGWTILTSFDYQNKKLTRLPKEFVDKYSVSE